MGQGWGGGGVGGCTMGSSVWGISRVIMLYCSTEVGFFSPRIILSKEAFIVHILTLTKAQIKFTKEKA